MEPYIQAHNHLVWEPFCGGLGFSRMLTDCRGLLSDVHPALISLYLGYRAGWRPPEAVDREQWLTARSLPDRDPLKAFVGFGCSMYGIYFSGLEQKRDRVALSGPESGKRWVNNPAAAAASTLRLLDRLTGFGIALGDFIEPDPVSTPCLVYCDPPYFGTKGYSGTPPFDHSRFWGRCQEWARYTTVLVSEHVCPVPHEHVWSYAKLRVIDNRWHAGTASRRATEYLFRVLPVPTPTVFDLCPAPAR